MKKYFRRWWSKIKKKKIQRIAASSLPFLEKTAPMIVSLLMVAAYAITFSSVSVFRVNHFDGMSGYDLSIPDQGIWLLSRFKTPFSTVRGLHIFGDHTPYIYLFIVPLYWLFNDIRALLILHATALGFGGFAVYLIAKQVFYDNSSRKESGSVWSTLLKAWTPTVFTFMYLLYPALNYLNMELLFSESFAVPLLMFGFYFLIRRKYRYFILLSFMTLLCKEDTAVTVFALGIYAFFKYNKKAGAIVLIAAVAWFMVDMFVLLPYFNGFGYFRHLYGYSVFGRLGPNPQEALNKIIKEPRLVYEILNTKENRKYIIDLLSPMAFIPVIGWSVLAIALPALTLNLMSGYYYTHYIAYHYTALLIPFINISTVYAVKWISDRKLVIMRWRVYFVVPCIFLLIAAVVYSNHSLGGEYNLIKNRRSIEYAIKNLNTYDKSHQDMLKAVKMMPDNASVSATYLMLTQLTHREKVYMFPSPFRPAYWGINGENLPKEKPDYIIGYTPVMEKDLRDLFYGLVTNGTYQEISEDSGVVVLKKISNA